MMYRIVSKRYLAKGVFEMDIFAPRVAKKCMAGQFVIIRVDANGERIPLTISDFDREKQTVKIVTQAVGATTLKLSRLNEGDSLCDFVGPLGNPSDLVTDIQSFKDKKIVFIAGGVGVAPIYPQVKWLFENGIKADVIVGARSGELLILENELKNVCKEVFVCTDDGSKGEKGRVTDLLEKLVDSGRSYDHCVTVGPVIMMKFVCILTKRLCIPTTVSMNPIMVDGTGMCGACRVTVGGKTKFACVDGPEFDGHEVDFDEAINRLTLYKTEEGRAFLKEKEGNTHHGGCGFCGGDDE